MICVFAIGQTTSFAETVILNIQAQINLAFTMNEGNLLSFGRTSLTTDPAFAPTITITPSGSVSFANTGGNANVTLLGNHAPAQLFIDASIAYADATITIQLSDSTPLTGPGPSSFTLNAFTYDDQIANSGTLPLNTPVNVRLNGLGQATVLIGSTLNSTAGGSYADGAYSGTFEIEAFL